MTWPIMTRHGQYSQFVRCWKTRIRKVCRICLDNLTNLASVIIVGDRAQVSWHWHALVSQAKESWRKLAEVEEFISTSDQIRHKGSIQVYWLDKPARLTIVLDCQIRRKKTNSETVTLSILTYPVPPPPLTEDRRKFSSKDGSKRAKIGVLAKNSCFLAAFFP